MNEDIAAALLALEARQAQAEQRLADLEFQLRQAHRDLERAQIKLGVLLESRAAREVSNLTNVGSVAWPGRTTRL